MHIETALMMEVIYSVHYFNYKTCCAKNGKLFIKWLNIIVRIYHWGITTWKLINSCLQSPLEMQLAMK